METMSQTSEEIALERIRAAAESRAEKIDLEGLELRSLPDELWELTNLRELDLQGLSLFELSPYIQKLVNLTKLDLRDNFLSSLPSELWSLPNLIELFLPQDFFPSIQENLWAKSDWKALGLQDFKFSTLPKYLFHLHDLTILDLSENQITSLPVEIAQLQNLSSLDLSGNQLTSLPVEIAQLQNLTFLNLSGNQLISLPVEIAQLQNLSSLDLTYNKFASLPVEIAQLQNLTSLTLSGNQLTSLPIEIIQLRNLTSLTLSSNQLISLPVEIAQLQNLTSLTISSNQLTSLPVEIAQLQNLTFLNLSGNQLTSLPVEIAQLQNLTSLDLSDNQLTSLPVEIAQLQNLTSLDLSDNQLTSLPVEIAQLQNLTSLDLGQNQFTSCPVEIAQLQSLTSLDFRNNELNSLFVEIVQLQNLTSLDLAGNQFTSLPAEITQFQNLTSLNLGQNQFTSLPAEIAQLQNLTSLDLSRLQLTSLPVEIIQLQNLTSLDLSGNQLTNLPIEITQLQRLTSLTLSNNLLKNLPAKIAQLQKLRFFELSSNRFINFPAEITKLQNLLLLDLSDNKIEKIPEEIAEIKTLVFLSLSNNGLTNLPMRMNYLRSLKYLILDNNPLNIAIPSKWLGEFNFSQEILSHYKQLHEEGGRPLGEVRILVVGEADAGKTKLLRALLKGEHGKNFVDTRHPTDGIEVNSLKGEDVSLRFWDFGGQEIMHATHRFFLSRRCVYVLVADSTRDRDYNEEKIEYWLELIKYYGGDSPVLLVATKTENFSLNVNERGLQEKYPNLVRLPSLQTSAKTGRGIEDLRRAIFEQAKKLPSASVMLPRSFLAVKDNLEVMKEKEKVKVIEEAIYRRLCEENGITEEERQNTLLQLLHDMGVVLHYENDDRLSDFGILNPDWATGGVYKVVNNPRIKESHGKFTMGEVKDFLTDESIYPAPMRRRIVDLMKKFELSYELPLERDTYILPSALPSNQPELTGWDEPAMTFEYRYPILQVSVLHRFMVTSHDLILDDLVWYSGVVLVRGENQALIRADFRDKKIHIKIKGAEETRKEFLYFIRMQFERIHGEESEPIEYISPPQCPKLFLSYEKIKKFLKAGTMALDEIYEDKPVKINLRELLDGFITLEERRRDEEEENKEKEFKLPGRKRGTGKSGDTNVTINIEKMESSNLSVGNTNSLTAISNTALKSEMDKLVTAVETLLQNLADSEHKEELKENLESLQEEMQRPKPRKRFYQVSVEGLAQAAKNLNDIGKPILELATTVIKLINTLPG
jgi:internalin A